jgi:formylglycine-generating enzyme required for sulfatase activity
MAEYWMASRPSGAPSPTADTEAFIAASRKTEAAARRRSRILNASLYTMLIAVILGLIGWINQQYIAGQWRWYTVARPFMQRQVRPFVLTTSQERLLTEGATFRECNGDGADYCPQMIVLPLGSFLMGSLTSEKWHREREEPQHAVTLARRFAVAKFELTYSEWDTCVLNEGCTQGISDNGWGRGQRPVTNVNWDDAQHYATWLSEMTGKPYRLLTEAEYEYATRAGTKTDYPWGDAAGQDHANCKGCSDTDLKTTEVGSFDPNAFGLFDMAGNAVEWVQDCWHENYNGAPNDGSAWVEGGDCSSRVVRGGSWWSRPELMRSASRTSAPSTLRENEIGFRVARTLDTP